MDSEFNINEPSTSSSMQTLITTTPPPTTTTNTTTTTTTSNDNTGNDYDNQRPWITDEYDRVREKLAHAAAFKLGINYNRMSKNEKMTFGTATTCFYLVVRNNILKIWLNNPKHQLELRHLMLRFVSKSESETKFIGQILNYLQRHGHVNFGVFRISRSLPRHKRTVVVIGAGLAGLFAARQLSFLGFDVLLYEAEKRFGGRAYSQQTKTGQYMHLGGWTLGATWSNPASVLVKQLSLPIEKLLPNKELYLDGTLVYQPKDKLMEECYRKLLHATHKVVVKCMNYSQLDNSVHLSLEQLFTSVIHHLDLALAKRGLNQMQDFLHIQNNINFIIDDMERKLKEFYTTFKKFTKLRLKEKKNVTTTKKDNISTKYVKRVVPDEHFDFDIDEINKKSNKVLKKKSFSQLYSGQLAFVEFRQLENKLVELKNERDQHQRCHSLVSEFFKVEDKRILNWHLAGLEYLLGAPLTDVSWQTMESYVFDRYCEQYFVPSGYMPIVEALHKVPGVEVVTVPNTKVTAVEVQEHFVCIKIQKERDNKDNEQHTSIPEEETIFADAVLCTVPLGVLKDSLKLNSTTDSSDSDKSSGGGGGSGIRFTPGFSARKAEAIQRLGFGTVIKVILVFEKKFWSTGEHLFAHAALPDCRGEYSLLFTDPDQPIVTGIICGTSAQVVRQRKLSNDLLVSRLMNLLRELFNSVPLPKLACVTDWHTNSHFNGTHTYLAVGASPDDFDAIAEPICSPYSNIPKVFFAGEHCSREHPGTAHGASQSGLRVAGQIADALLGPIRYFPEEEEEKIRQSKRPTTDNSQNVT